MLTITCDSPGTLSRSERAKPFPGLGEVLVKIRRVGVCGTDLHIFTGNQPYLSYPRVMGHELAATVEEAPPGSSLQAGDTVSIIPYISCGHCSACRKGKTNCCRNIGVLGVHRDGGMTEYLSLPEKDFPVASKQFEAPIMDREYFDALANRFRPPHLWEHDKGEWKLRRRIFDQN